MYYINYHTGAGDNNAETLEQAKVLADQGAAYTQQPITIHDEDGEEVARRNWFGVEYNAEDDQETMDPITYGSFGYYGDWQE
ncbi:hypothetical protein [Harryflintia acetispora]|uniref:Uncharacterized protein n=1 Tax=Harryflintia acetispora TaxID=1849041 RepID=A0A9X8UJU3_9FIRM|nr:hypothetical protein [Harryflintia acetispora]TCL43205.1 hypothetical protein EDD78_10665 [Harryflintia acetispora]